ncbi:MAG: ABC transporter permease [Provencibacterium sp.]|nr:ABC transporter permease [Provencibacterium sp.]
MRSILEDFKKYGYFFAELVSRDFKSKYYKSFLGILWTILHPLLRMCIMTIVFSTLFRRNIRNFPIYYLTGFLVFHLCTDASTQSLHAVTGNSGLILKIHIPSYFFALSKVALVLINTLFSMISLVLIMLITRAPIHWTFLLFPLPLFLTLLFAAGLSMALSAMAVYFRDLFHLYSLVTLVWTYLTPLFYPISIIPEQWLFLIKLNPMYHYVSLFRALVYEGVLPSGEMWLITSLISVAVLVGGGYIFHRLKSNFFLHL